MSTLHVSPIPCLKDNYAYLVETDGACAVVDPSEAGPVIEALGDRQPHALWLTHHHWDHVGGIEALCERYPALEVWGSAVDAQRGRIPKQTRALGHGDQLKWGGTTVDILHTPGHTAGALVYVADGHAFTGDTLFSGGCGRLFEGTPEQMFESLLAILTLPPATCLWFGHEYTIANLRFALAYGGPHPETTQRLHHVEALRQANLPTTPSTVATELATNIFVRTALTEARRPEAIAHFTAARNAKDTA